MRKTLRLSLLLLYAVLFSPFFSSCKKLLPNNEKSLVVWHWMTDREPAFLELAKRYKEATGIDVQFQLYAPSDNYSQKVRVGAQTNTLPDIYSVLGESRDLASFIEAGHVENLTAFLMESSGAWKNSFYTEALNTTRFKADNPFKVPEGFYGIPIDVTTIPMIYNKSLFAKAGLDPAKPPKTWEEFLVAGTKLKAIGVNGFVSGWQETWLIYSLFTDLAHNLMGAEKVMNTFRGLVPYTDSQWIEVFTAFEQMHKAGFADPSLVTLGNKYAEQSFSTERAGITFNGSWAVNVYAGMNPALDYAPFPPPALNPKNPRSSWGGAGTFFVVNSKSTKKQMTVDFLKWLSGKDQAAYLVTATKNLPAIKDIGGSVSPVLQGFSSMMENSIHPNRFEVTEDPRVQEVITKGIQSILIGEKTAADIAASAQKSKSMNKGK